MKSSTTLQNSEDAEIVAARHALWSVGILSWKLWQQQIPIYDRIRSLPPEVDEAVILCARQFGKSYAGVLMAVEDCLQWHDRCFIIIGPTIKQTRDIVTPRLRKIAADAPEGLIRPSKSEGKWFIGTSELVMGGFDQGSSSQRGKTVQNIYVEELVDANPDNYLETLRSDLAPALTHSMNGKIIYLTTLPKIPDHPFITDTMARAEMNNALFRFTIDDNKALSKAQYEAAVRRSGGKNTTAWLREYMCQIVRDRSVVIVPDFSDADHVMDYIIPQKMNCEVYTDWGGVRDKTVSLLMGYSYLEGVDLVLDEMSWPPNTATEQIVADIRRKWADKASIHYVDAPGQLQVDLKISHDMTVRVPKKDDWEAAINNLAVRFTQKKIRIKPHCKLLIQTCRSGMFTKNRTDFERTEALGHCDALAALMYGVRQLNRSNPFSSTAQVGYGTNQWQPPKTDTMIPLVNVPKMNSLPRSKH